MKYIISGVTLILLVVGAFLLFKSPSSIDPLVAYGMDQLSVTELVAQLENRTDEPNTLKANIDSSGLNITANGQSVKVDLPSDMFYLSFVPYINTTHPCGIHNLISCRGELKQEEFHVLISDDLGNIIIDEYMESFANGFLGVWIPSNMNGTIFITYQGLIATTLISSFSGDYTCLTTLELTNEIN